ncbi:hypothetical protein KKE92_02700, partial [Candidatus Micrarchaeota archaeon]|nr:hypothetical protein [Candidatus Micrarchaeota archaeon]
CMIFKEINATLIPYYVEPEDYEVTPEKGQQMSIGCKDIHYLPRYQMTKPPDAHIIALKLIEEKGGTIKKNDLIHELEKADMIQVQNDEETKNKASAKYAALNRGFIKPLLEWKFIEIVGTGKRAKVKITKDGKNALTFLG